MCSLCAPLRPRVRTLAPAYAGGNGHLQNARPARPSAHARVCVLALVRPTRLVRVWPRVYTPLVLLREQERRNDVPWEGQTSWSHITYESIAW
jgi:hypothetical protein